VVEVGLNISARQLHSEIAPASSVIQRAGRCARFERQRGSVPLYPLPPGRGGRRSYRPYDEPACLATLEAFARYEGQAVGFREEQQVIDAVHTDQDAELLQDFEQQRDLIGAQIYRGWSEHSRSIASDLIRDVQQATLLIHDDPSAAVTERPWEWQTFRMHPGSLEGAWDALAEAHAAAQTLDSQQPAMVWQAALADPAQERDAENERRAARYQWTPLASKAQIRGALVLAVAPTVATYTSELGLVLNDGRLDLAWPAQPYRSAPVPQRRRGHGPIFYTQESYAEHIAGLLRAYQALLWQDTRFAAGRLEQAVGLHPGAVDQAVRLAIACHDIAKLGQGWQAWALGWQALLCQTYPHLAGAYQPRKAPFAHTDMETREQRELERAYTRKTPRPHHACESAYLALPLIERSLGEEAVEQGLARAVAGAIARHHTPGAVSYSPTALIPEARAQVQATLELVRQGQPWSCDIADLDLAIARPGDLTKQDITLPRSEIGPETLLYFLIVRALRLADVRSFRYK
jgi:CRISPR-associated endonuclease/helicase Cas3